MYNYSYGIEINLYSFLYHDKNNIIIMTKYGIMFTMSINI